MLSIPPELVLGDLVVLCISCYRLFYSLSPGCRSVLMQVLPKGNFEMNISTEISPFII